MSYRGPYRVRAEQKSAPYIEHPKDTIVRINRVCIFGSDLHLYHGLVSDTRICTTFGHEFTGVLEEVGSAVQKVMVASVFVGLGLLMRSRSRRHRCDDAFLERS